MGARRVLLIAAQHGEPPSPIEGDETIYILADMQGAKHTLQSRLSFDAIVIAGDGANWSLLRHVVDSGYPAPVIALVPPGRPDLAREALAIGALGCVVRTAGYGEQLRWALDAASAHHRLQRQHRQLGDALGARLLATSEAERQREDARDRLRAALHHLSEGVLIVDARLHTVLAANAAAERLFGTMFTQGATFTDRPTYRLLDRDGRALAPEETPIGQTSATERAHIGERLIIERADGTQIAIVSSAVPLHDEAGELREIVSIYHELTDQVHAQLVRDEVLSIASHELRTPLTVILGYSSLLRTLPAMHGDARTRRAVTKIYEQSLRMRDLIEYLLDFSRIALGRIQLQWVDFDLTTLVREVGQQQADAGHRPLRLALPDEPLAMTGDYSRLAQALQQVIRATWQEYDQREVVIAIHTGTTASFRTIGVTLPPETKRRYALIQVGRTSPARAPLPGNTLSAVEGTLASDKALELTISAELVRMHGGALLVEPQPSEGSAFSLLLPLQDTAIGG